MKEWDEVKKNFTFISKERMTAIEILADLEIDYDEEKITKIEKRLNEGVKEYKQIADNSVKCFMEMVDASVELDKQKDQRIEELEKVLQEIVRYSKYEGNEWFEKAKGVLEY